MFDAAPAHVGDVEQTVHAGEVDEGAEVGDVLDAAAANLALFNLGEEFAFLVGLLVFEEFAARDDDVLALVGDFDDFELEGLSDVAVCVVDGDEVNLGTGEEGFDIFDLDGQPAADFAGDGTADDCAFGVFSDDGFPADFLVGHAFGDGDHASFFVFEVLEEDIDFGADLNGFGVFELGGADGAFGLIADVDEDIAAFDCADAAFDDGAGGELDALAAEGGVEQVVEVAGLGAVDGRFADCH